MSQSRQASREPGAPTLPATINLNDVSVATVSKKPIRRRRTQIVERLLAVEIPAPESRSLDTLSRTSSQLLHTSGFTMRLQSVEIPVAESRIMSRPSHRAVISAAEASRVDRTFCEAFIPLPGSRKADRPSRRALKRRGFLELGEIVQQARPISSISGGHSMTEDNPSVHSRLESSSGSVITRIIAQLCVISPFRIPRSLSYRPLLRRLRSSQRSLGDLLRSTRSTTIVQRALGSNVGHLAVRSVGAQTYPVEDIPRRETASSSEHAQAAPGTNFGHVAVRSIGTKSSPDNIPKRYIALSSKHVRSSDSGQPAQILMRQAARLAQEASIKENARKLDKPRSQEELRPQPVLKSILKKRGLPPLSEPLYGDPHRARPYTGILFKNFEEGNVLRSARKSEDTLRRVAAVTHRDRSEEEQPPEIPNPNLTGTFRVPSPSSSEDSELSEVKCGADLGSSRAELEAIRSNIELSLAGFHSRRADLQKTGANYAQELRKCPATAVEVPQTERNRGFFVETQEGVKPFDDRTHNEAGLNFERMGSEPRAELMVVADLCSRSADEYLANGSPIGGAQVNSMRSEANRQVAVADFSRANDSNQASLLSIPILSGPTTKGDDQDAMDTSPDIVATKAVSDRVPFNAADEYLATKSPRVRAYLDSLFTEEDCRVAVEDFASEMERHQVQAQPAPIVTVPTPNVVDLVQEADIADSRATTIVRAPLDTYLTMISP